MTFWSDLASPPREFTVFPFWFWNDDLDEGELRRQIADFEAHGVHGFVVHPRVGLPRTLGWMSDSLLHFYDVAVEEARRRAMQVILYDEGMYPSGSSSGQVVAENPAYQCRCLDRLELTEDVTALLTSDQSTNQPIVSLPPGQTLVAVVRRANGQRLAIVDRPLDAFIRGLHYAGADGEGPAEDEPPAADLLNPDAVACFIRLVYDRFAARLGQHFGETIVAIFTDEPSPLGRPRERGIWPGTTGILAHVNRLLGYDFAPHLPALWFDDEPDAARHRHDYARAIALRMEETWYRQLHDWCDAHNLPLTGHPAQADDLGAERYFHIPGQDLVWRWVLPDHPTALEGEQSTQGKCGSSAMLHLGRRRNANECCGAYGYQLTWAEMNWLADWCFVRGVNLIIPHAFYYSVRGNRRDERPPDVGPHSPWWDRYREYADRCRRLSWLNTDCTHVCEIAILGAANFLPWAAARVCFQHQADFNYLEERHLWEDAAVSAEGVRVGGMHYKALIVEHEPQAEAGPALALLAEAGRLIRYTPAMADAHLLAALGALTAAGVAVSPPAPALRVRHVIKDGRHIYLLFNEEGKPLAAQIQAPTAGTARWFDAVTGQQQPFAAHVPVRWNAYELRVLVVEPPPEE